VAIKEILSDPTTYGFHLQSDELYPPLDDCKILIETESIENLGDYAVKHGTTYRMLKVYNPWLTNSSLTIKKGNEYKIKIPNKN
jgi:hypothetical protein